MRHLCICKCMHFQLYAWCSSQSNQLTIERHLHLHLHIYFGVYRMLSHTGSNGLNRKIPLLSLRFNHQIDTLKISTGSLQTSAGSVFFLFTIFFSYRCIASNDNHLKLTERKYNKYTHANAHSHSSAINIVCIQKNEIP